MAITDAREHRVYVRQLWSQDWTLVPNLFCDSFTEACSPNMPEATLYWNYGDLVPYGDITFQSIDKQEYLDFFVKIELDQPGGATREWYGTIKEEIDRRRGGFGNNTPSGQQFYRAYGMEYFLARQQITTSWTLSHIDLTDQEIKRAIGFNLGDGNGNSGRFVANRSTIGGTKGDNIFTDSANEDTNEWIASTVLDYLLTYLAPKDNFGIEQIPYRLDPAYSDQLASLAWWKLQIYCEGRTLKEVIDLILHRQRLMSYRLQVVNNEVLLQSFTFTEAAILLPSLVNIRANNRPVSWNFDDAALVVNADIVRDTQPYYDVVTTRSERATSTFTMETSVGESTVEALDADWDSTLETAYNDGAPSAAATADWYLKSQRHRNFRKEEQFERVYRYFRIPTNWDGTTSTGENVMIQLDDVDALDTFWRAGLRFEPVTPLKTDVDYETVASVSDDTPAGTLNEYRRPFAIWIGGSETDRPFYLDRPAAAAEYGEFPEASEREWAIVVRPQENGFGFILDVQGAPQHVIAEDEFSAADTADENDYVAEIRWQDIAITATIRLDSYCQGQWPDPLPPIPGSVQRTIVLDVPGKRLDYVVPDTIVDVDDGDVKRSDGGFIQDDRQECEDIARLTYDWYATERRSLDVSLRTTDTILEVGDMVLTIGNLNTLTTVNSVITSMVFDLRQHGHTVRTQFGELDLRGL